MLQNHPTLLSPTRASGSFYPYEIANSLRFDSASSPKLTRTNGSAADNNKICTYSGWVKRSELGSLQTIFTATNSGGSGNLISISWLSTDELRVVFDGAGTYSQVTTAKFRDVGAFLHICVGIDTTQATAADRVTVEVNGDVQTCTGTLPPLNHAFQMGASDSLAFSDFFSSRYLGCYKTKEAFFDGTKYSASDCGMFKNGIWIPKDISALTFGTLGAHLDYEDGTSATTLGYDVSGNANHFTPSGIATTDQMIDTPTNNFCTWNPITGAKGDAFGNITADLNTYSNGNLEITSSASAGDADSLQSISTMAIPDSVPIYAEFTNVHANTGISVGGDFTYDNPGSGGGGETFNGRVFYYSGVVGVGFGATGTVTGTPATFNSGDTLAIRVDKTAQTIKFYKNDVLQATVSSVTIPDDNWYFQKMMTTSGGAGSIKADFGQLGFTYSLPTDHFPLSSANLPEPTIGPNSTIKPDDVFRTELSTGNGTAKASGGKMIFTDVDFTDGDYMVVGKNRDVADSWACFDTVRGDNKYLQWDNSTAETTDTETLEFTSAGCKLGSNHLVNASGEDYVFYMFKVTPGFFDIVSGTGTGVARNISHSLGEIPNFIIGKRHDAAVTWPVYCSSLPVADPETDYLALDTNAAVADLASLWNDTAPTSSVFTVGTSGATNLNAGQYIYYLFADVEGFCKTGYYKGNGSADGTFEHLGLSPQFQLLKKTNGAASWYLHDTARSPGNVADTRLYVDLPGAEGAGGSYGPDLVSNGAKIRTTDTGWNTSTGDYITLSIGISSKYANAR